jgi:hypothetical protein
VKLIAREEIKGDLNQSHSLLERRILARLEPDEGINVPNGAEQHAAVLGPNALWHTMHQSPEPLCARGERINHVVTADNVDAGVFRGAGGQRAAQIGAEVSVQQRPIPEPVRLFSRSVFVRVRRDEVDFTRTLADRD